MVGGCGLITNIIVFFQQQQAGELAAQTTQEQLVMFCSSRLERVSHGSDLRLRSQDGKSKKEEAPSSWPASQLIGGLEYRLPV